MKQIFFLLSITIGLITACGGSSSDQNTGVVSSPHSSPNNGAQPLGGGSSALDKVLGKWKYFEPSIRRESVSEAQIYELYRGNNSQILLKFDFEERFGDQKDSMQKFTVIVSVKLEPDQNLIEMIEIIEIKAVESDRDLSDCLNKQAFRGTIKTHFDENAQLVCKDGKLFRLLKEKGQTKEIELTRVEKEEKEDEQKDDQEILKKI